MKSLNKSVESWDCSPGAMSFCYIFSLLPAFLWKSISGHNVRGVNSNEVWQLCLYFCFHLESFRDLLPIQQVLSKLFKRKLWSPGLLFVFSCSVLQLLPKLSDDGRMCRNRNVLKKSNFSVCACYQRYRIGMWMINSIATWRTAFCMRVSAFTSLP